MKTAFIIHGTWGSPEWNWFEWLGEKLKDQGYTVIIPRFPTPQGQSLQSWTEKFEEYKKYINDETIFIAHSSGPAFVLSILENIDTQVHGCFFVSGFLELIQLPEFDIINETITSRQFNWERIHQNCSYFYMCHGDDDPYVPFYNVEILAENLKVEVDIIENGEHLNEESGYTQFPYLLDIIKKYI